MPQTAKAPAVPRLTYLRIKNYRALRDVEFRDLTPLTVLIGPNGSGKSTVLDALDFLAEAVRGNMVGAWEKRNRFAGMRTRGSEGNIEFEIGIRVLPGKSVMHYALSLIEHNSKPYEFAERIVIKQAGKADKLHYESKTVEMPTGSTGYSAYTFPLRGKTSILSEQNLDAYKFFKWPLNSQGGLFTNDTSNPLVASIGYNNSRSHTKEIAELTSTVTSYRYVHLTDDHLKGYSDAGPRERLSPNGDNLPNVLYYLHTRHPETLAKITAQLRRWVPALADIVTEITSDERLLLRFKDAPFEKPLPAQYMSDGTMRLAALLTLLYEPDASGLLGIEEPENELHPLLLAHLAEELIDASEKRQLLVATHSPALLNALEPEQVWVLHRGTDGYTQATRTADLPGIPAMVAEGSPLGYLWARNFFDVGNPLDLPTPVK
jgi:predicted ATPase